VPELLLEILSEEIPARMQARAADDLKRLVCDGLKAAGLTFTGASAYVTPRRLALVVEGIPERLPDLVEERKGPRVDSPTKAIQGFLRSTGLDSLEQCQVREVKGVQYYFAVIEKEGWETVIYLGSALIDVVRKFPWPKTMKWGEGKGPWIRPLHNILCIFGQEGVVITLENQTGYRTRETVGHRFLAPALFEVTDFADYEAKLRQAKVILDREERKAIIAAEAAKLAKAEGLALKDDPGLLEELAGLVEWPQVLMGRIDDAYMDLPPEVLTTTMRSHQKYLATLDRDGRLAGRFAFVANLPARKGSKRYDNIVAGNERVLRARLADARFFWDQDRKRSLAAHVPGLSQMVFHAKLGSLDAKIDRVQALATALARQIPGADVDRVRSAARLAKADLTTGMVGEFPELQGVMGRNYALADGEHAEVAEAIAEHYAPLGPNDRCPSQPVSVAVALADKIDTLVGFWAIGEPPTGSKDPYALRRAALGVIRLIVENRLRLPLTPVIETARDLYRELAGPAITGSLLDFFADRLKVALRDKGVRHDLISAVFALGGEDDLVRLLARVDALQDFLNSEDGENLLTAYKRAENIVRIEEKRDKSSYRAGLRLDLLVDPVEKTLAEHLDEATSGAKEALGSEEYSLAMEAMAKLRRPVDEFFDSVMVNTEDADLRANRLRLLSAIGDTLGQVADFSRIEG
jgi:glycyl-tRNA synthetase beta chain